MSTTSLDELLSQLPEHYQPIYGQEGTQTSRTADSPRTEQILSTIDLISSYLGRPLRILDLGSAQGYFCFLAAERQHHVTGVDYLPINIAVSRALHDLHPELPVEFVESDITAVSDLVSNGNFDLVLSLSVLHHIVYTEGQPAAIELVRHLRDNIAFGLFEMALREEPMYWASNQPADPRVTVAPYEFIRELAWSPTHLSDVERPLLFCSRTHTLINGQLQPIRRYAETSHPAAALVLSGKRRYYEIDEGIVKIAAQFAEVVDDGLLRNLQDEARQEVNAIEKLTGSSIEVPRIIEFHDALTEVIVAKTMFPGTLLSEVLPTMNDAERLAAVDQVLQQLADLEGLGWYHTDLRTWNVVWDETQRTATLIDQGALSQLPTDTAWPNDAHYSFIVFAIALWTGTADPTGLDSLRSITVEITELPRTARRVLMGALTRPRSIAFFADLLAEWRTIDSMEDDPVEPPLAVDWLFGTGAKLRLDEAGRREEITALLDANRQMQAMQADTLAAHESLVETHQRTLEGYADLEATHAATLDAYTERDRNYHEVLKSYQRIDNLYRAAREALEVATADLVRTHDELHHTRLDRDHHVAQASRAAGLEQSLNAVTRTLSWRITKPLRVIRRLRRSSKSPG